MPECYNDDCERTAVVQRQSERDGHIHNYCKRHDPLQDDRAFAFSEVGE